MRKKVVGTVLFLSLLLAGCTRDVFVLPVQENPEAAMRFNKLVHYDYNSAHYPVIIENFDTQGKAEKQVFYKPPERVVAVWQNSIETLLALGVGDRIIAGNGILDKKFLLPQYQEQYTQIPYTGLQLLDVETTMMLKPDFIVGWYSTFMPKVLRPTNFWHKRGVNTFIARSSIGNNKPRTLANEYKDILDLGKIFDKNERAEQIVNDMQQKINEAKEKTASYKVRPRTLVGGFYGNEFGVYGKTSLAGDIVNELHGDLLAANERSIGLERVVDLDPDVIFILVMESHYGREDEIISRITQHKGLKNLRCVKEGRVIPLPLNAVYSSGVRTYDGIKIIAKGMYPDLYKEN